MDETEIYAGTYVETESGYILDPDVAPSKTSPVQLIYAENISPFTYVWEEGDGISEIEDGESNSQLSTLNSQFYNLAGQRVSKPAKGLYIIGGKKVLVK